VERGFQGMQELVTVLQDGSDARSTYRGTRCSPQFLGELLTLLLTFILQGLMAGTVPC